MAKTLVLVLMVTCKMLEHHLDGETPMKSYQIPLLDASILILDAKTHIFG